MALTPDDLRAIRIITQEVTKEVAVRTQEELAGMINSSFQNVDRRFEAIDKLFQGLDKRLGEHVQQTADIKLTLADHSILLHHIDRRSHDQQQRSDHHEIRLRRLEKHQGLRPLPGTVDA